MIQILVRYSKHIFILFLTLWITVFVYTLVHMLHQSRHQRAGDISHYSRESAFPYVQPQQKHKTNDNNNLNLSKDWHDYKFIEYEKNRTGFGENGKPAKLNPFHKEEEYELFNLNGYNAALSDRISYNRSVPDIRHLSCQKKKYLSKLPAVSVIIPFYNEHLSTLLRTLHSLINRTPTELLTEIIIIDDCSDKGIF